MLLALLLAAGPSWDAALRLESRRDAVPSPLIVSEADPVLGFRSAPGELSMRLRYDPSLLLSSGTSAVLHRAEASESLRLDGHSSLQLDQRATIGRQLFSALEPGSALPPERLPPRRFLQVVDALGSAGWAGSPAPRWTAGIAAAFGVSGGLDAEAQKFLPLQRTPSARATAEYALSRLDTALVALAAAGSFSSRGRTGSAGLTGGVRSRLGTAWTADASAGAAFASSTVAGSTPQSLLPLASAGAAVKLPARIHLEGSLHGLVTSAIDPITLRLYRRGELRAAFDAEPLRGLRLSLVGVGGAAFGTVSGRLAESDASVSVQLAPGVALAAGGRAAWLSDALQGPAAGPFSWSAYVAASSVASGAF